MRTHFHGGFGPYLRRTASTAGIVTLSVVSTLLVQHVLTPAPASARAVREQARNAVYEVPGGAGGTLARLGPGPEGNGNLRLWDTAGNLRVQIAGNGTETIWDANGNVVWSVP